MCAESQPIPDFHIFTVDVSPFSFSPNMVRKTVKLMGPGASFSISSSSSCFTLRRPVAACRKVINVSKPKEKHWKTLFKYLPRAAKVSLKSFLSMKPSLFWSMMVKACSRPHFKITKTIIPFHNLCVLFIGHLELYTPPPPPFSPRI